MYILYHSSRIAYRLVFFCSCLGFKFLPKLSNIFKHFKNNNTCGYITIPVTSLVFALRILVQRRLCLGDEMMILGHRVTIRGPVKDRGVKE